MLFLNIDHLQRRLKTLRFSLDLYQKAEPTSIDQEVFRNAIIKGYELTQETSFKVLKKALKVYGHSAKELASIPVKDLLRLAATHALMTPEVVERWFVYRNNSNNTAHEYGEGFTHETLRLMPEFLKDMNTLIDTLNQKLGPHSAHANS